MFEAAQQILRDAGRPMHAREIHSEIVRRGLFRFGAKDPVAVLGQTLAEHIRSYGLGRDANDHCGHIVFLGISPQASGSR
jgi:hypothetical protein